jgi:hypothetical protein
MLDGGVVQREGPLRGCRMDQLTAGADTPGGGAGFLSDHPSDRLAGFRSTGTIPE